MSCIELSKNHYQKIADSIDTIVWKFYDSTSFNETKSLFKSHDSKFQAKMILEYVQSLQKLNLKAYDERYPHQFDAGYEIDYVTKINAMSWSDLNIAQLLKLLECVDYQCCDWKLWERTMEYKILKDIIDDCKSFLIESLPEYEKAAWVID